MSGAAANSIMRLPLTVSNYEAEIEILQKTFVKTSVIIQAHTIRRLLSLSPLNSSDNNTDFCRSVDEFPIRQYSAGYLGYCDDVLRNIYTTHYLITFGFQSTIDKNSEDSSLQHLLEF